MPPWITSSVVMWIGIVLIVLIGNYFGYMRRASRDRMLEKLAEKGQPLPAELFGDRDGGNCRHPFTTSFILMGVGIALALFFWGMTGGGGFFAPERGVPTWLPVLGIFPFAVGIARLLGAIFDRRGTK